VSCSDAVAQAPTGAGASTPGAGAISTQPADKKIENADRMRFLSSPTLQDLLNLALSLGAVISIILLVFFVLWDTFRHSITIEPLSVPKGMSENRGFSPNVAARRLQDSIDKVMIRVKKPSDNPQRSSSSSISGSRDADIFAIPGQETDIIQETDLPSITLPAVGLARLFCDNNPGVSWYYATA
jgi:hypothetical protein